jgi:hypothetical protein
MFGRTNSPPGHAIVEFILVFPFFLVLVWGTWDMVLLSLSRISLQHRCFESAQAYASAQTLPVHLSKEASLSLQDLPFSSSEPLRARRKIQILRLELTSQPPLHFPFLRLVFRDSPLIIKARSAVLRLSYE